MSGDEFVAPGDLFVPIDTSFKWSYLVLSVDIDNDCIWVLTWSNCDVPYVGDVSPGYRFVSHWNPIFTRVR